MIDKTANRSMAGASESKDRGITYVGHKQAVVVNTDGPSFVFKNGQPQAVPADLAKQLLAQPDKFKGE